MTKKLFMKHWFLSGLVTCGVAVFCVGMIFVYRWTMPAIPLFTTQALDCTTGIACDRDTVCDDPCETLESCPRDCAMCGNGTCDPWEDIERCPADCLSPASCGNWICESGEDYQSCSDDCARCVKEGEATSFTYSGWCTAQAAGLQIGTMCSCSETTCPEWTEGSSFTCPYEGVFLSAETDACDNWLDDDNDALVDCADIECAAQELCVTSPSDAGGGWWYELTSVGSGDGNFDGIADSMQTGYVATVTQPNATTITLSVTGSDVMISSFGTSSIAPLSWRYYPAGSVQFSLGVQTGGSVTTTLRVEGISVQTWLVVVKYIGTGWLQLASGAWSLVSSGNALRATYILTDNGAYDNSATGGWIEDPIAIACSDANNDTVCDTVSTVSEICTWGSDEDVDGFVDCADSDCFWTSTCCSDTLINGDETDVDCGGSCGSGCVAGLRCREDADCIAASCIYGILWAADLASNSQEYAASFLWVLPATTFPVVTSDLPADPDREWYDNRLLIKFKEENNLLLPAFSDDLPWQSKERYVWYLVWRVSAVYEQQGIAPLLLVRAVNELFTHDLSEIEQLYTTLSSQQDAATDLQTIYRVVFDENANLEEIIDELEQNIAIEFIEKEPLYKVAYTDTQANQQWYLSHIDADDARNAGASGQASVVVAVIDNGFDLSHPDLQGALLAWWDVANNDSNPSLPSAWLSDSDGSHGTHTIGTVAAVTNNGLWVASVGWGIRAVPVKATADVYDPVYVTHAYQALQYAVGRSDVDVISMSFWWPPSSSMQALIEAHPEKIFVAAAGNDNTSAVQYPAGYSSVVAVAATNGSGQKASFSNYGSRVDISAPGVAILSTAPAATYLFQNGTSMATPIVASTIWLLLSLGDTNPVQTIKNTTDSIPWANGLMGAGRINVCKAVQTRWIACTASDWSTGGVSTGSVSTWSVSTWTNLTWWLSTGGTTVGDGRGVCVAISSTWWATTLPRWGKWSTISTGQQYPIGTIDISSSVTNPKYGQLVEWQLERAYTTYAPAYPLASLEVEVVIPPWLGYLSGSVRSSGDASLIWTPVYQQGVLSVALKPSWAWSAFTNTTRKYTGKIRFMTQVMSSSAQSPVEVRSNLRCYDLLGIGYAWTATCSVSAYPKNAVQMQTATKQLLLNGSAGNTWTTWATTTWTTIWSGGRVATWILVELCGNGQVQWAEQCDDGNTRSGDGCFLCRPETGRRCIPTSPSQCGSDDCFMHGAAFTESNIFGACCGWLNEIVITPTSAVLTWLVKTHICYDPTLWQPFCDTRTNPSGWRVPTGTADTHTLVLEDSCRSIYKDYYVDLINELQADRPACLFSEVPYDGVAFQDISTSKQKIAIETLRDACVIQWVGTWWALFSPTRTIQRAELIKMIVKLLVIAEGSTGKNTFTTTSGQLTYLDVPTDFWGAGYIAEADRRGILSAWSHNGMMTFFKPFASVRRDEFISLLRRLPAGQFLRSDDIDAVIWTTPFVTRWAAAELLVKKFLPTLQPYFYFQWTQEDYYWQLAEQLRGKNYQQQYALILSQIDTFARDEKMHGAASQKNQQLNPFRVQQFLRQLIY